MGENEKSKTLGKNFPGRGISMQLSDAGASSSNSSLRVILVSQVLGLVKLRFVSDLFNHTH